MPRSLRALAALVLLALTMSSPASAQDAQPAAGSNITAGPAIIDVALDAGKSYEAPITVTNGSNQAVIISPTVEALSGAEGQEGTLDESFDATTWFQFDKTPFTLAANTQQTFDITVQTPTSAEPGGHYATVFFSAQPASQSPGGNLSINARVGVVSLITISGPTTRDVELTAIDTPKRFSVSTSPINVNMHVANHGTIHVVPQALLQVDDRFGREFVPVTVDGTTLLPGFDTAINGSFTPGWLPGIYTVSAALSGPDLGATLSTQTIVVIPWWWFAALGAVVVLIVVAILLRRRRAAIRRARNAALVRATTSTAEVAAKSDS